MKGFYQIPGGYDYYPKYPNLGATVAKFRREVAKAGSLMATPRELRRAYAEAIFKAIRAKGDYPGLDLCAMWSLFAVIIALVGVVVFEARVSILRSHADAFVQETIVGVVRPAKGIVITDIPVVNELSATRSHISDVSVAGRRSLYVNGQGKLDCWKHGDQSRDADGRASTWYINIKGVPGWSYDKTTNSGKSDIIGWRLPIIFSNQMDSLFADNAKILNVSRRYTNVSAQLALFLIIHDPGLILASRNLLPAVFGLKNSSDQYSYGERYIEGNANSESNFQSKLCIFATGFFWVLFVIVFGKGFKSFVEGSSLFCGAAMMFFGWLSAVAGVVTFISWLVGHLLLPIFAENVSAVPGIDISAARYCSLENVGVRPIIIPELKLRNVERHVLLANLVESADHTTLDDRPETFNRIGVHGTNDVFASASWAAREEAVYKPMMKKKRGERT